MTRPLWLQDRIIANILGYKWFSSTVDGETMYYLIAPSGLNNYRVVAKRSKGAVVEIEGILVEKSQDFENAPPFSSHAGTVVQVIDEIERVGYMALWNNPEGKWCCGIFTEDAVFGETIAPVSIEKSDCIGMGTADTWMDAVATAYIKMMETIKGIEYPRC